MKKQSVVITMLIDCAIAWVKLSLRGRGGGGVTVG